MKNIKIGLVSVSDRASNGTYKDEGLPALREWLDKAIINPKRYFEHLIPDEQNLIEKTLINLVDEQQCSLILTTGGTGPSLRDVTPDATLAIADKIMPGLGEQMRQISLHYVPSAILSRQVGVIRKNSLILNLPGKPNSIRETLEGAKDERGEIKIAGIFTTIPLCIEIIGGPYIKTNDDVIKAFWPKSLIHP